MQSVVLCQLGHWSLSPCSSPAESFVSVAGRPHTRLSHVALCFAHEFTQRLALFRGDAPSTLQIPERLYGRETQVRFALAGYHWSCWCGLHALAACAAGLTNRPWCVVLCGLPALAACAAGLTNCLWRVVLCARAVRAFCCFRCWVCFASRVACNSLAFGVQVRALCDQFRQVRSCVLACLAADVLLDEDASCRLRGPHPTIPCSFVSL